MKSFYLTLGNQDSESTVNSKSETESNQCLEGRSFIGDGICDESLNNELCLFDGDDCCMELKSTPQCIEDCSCKRLLDEDSLKTDLDRNEVKVADMDYMIGWTIIKKVTDVVSAEVCSSLCLEIKPHDVVDGWYFDGDCSCLWVNSLFFCSQLENIDLVPYTQFPKNQNAIGLLFLKTVGLPDCGTQFKIHRNLYRIQKRFLFS